MKYINFFICLGVFLSLRCTMFSKNSSSANNSDTNDQILMGSNCSISYSGSHREHINVPTNCQNVTIINSGSGNLIISSKAVLERATIVNSGSNNANLNDLKAKKIFLTDRGSGNLQIYSLVEISGTSRGSGTIIISGTGKVSISNNGSGSIITPEVW